MNDKNNSGSEFHFEENEASKNPFIRDDHQVNDHDERFRINDYRSQGKRSGNPFIKLLVIILLIAAIVLGFFAIAKFFAGKLSFDKKAVQEPVSKIKEKTADLKEKFKLSDSEEKPKTVKAAEKTKTKQTKAAKKEITKKKDKEIVKKAISTNKQVLSLNGKISNKLEKFEEKVHTLEAKLIKLNKPNASQLKSFQSKVNALQKDYNQYLTTISDSLSKSLLFKADDDFCKIKDAEQYLAAWSEELGSKLNYLHDEAEYLVSQTASTNKKSSKKHYYKKAKKHYNKPSFPQAINSHCFNRNKHRRAI